MEEGCPVGDCSRSTRFPRRFVETCHIITSTPPTPGAIPRDAARGVRSPGEDTVVPTVTVSDNRLTSKAGRWWAWLEERSDLPQIQHIIDQAIQAGLIRVKP